MASQKDNFWVGEPCILFSDMAFLPTKDMTQQEKLNALTRLAIIISIVMYLMDYEYWFSFLTLSILFIIIINYSCSLEKFKKGSMKNENMILEDSEDEDSSSDEEKEEDIIENFSIVPTYSGADFQQTVIAPTFAEEWQIPPPAYDLYTNVPYPESSGSRDTFETPLKQQSYPYGQYLTRTNLLPSDEYYTHLGCGGARSARSYVNGAFLRHDLARRENMSRIYKKRLNRRYRHNGCNDSFSPFVSY